MWVKSVPMMVGWSSCQESHLRPESRLYGVGRLLACLAPDLPSIWPEVKRHRRRLTQVVRERHRASQDMSWFKTPQLLKSKEGSTQHPTHDHVEKLLRLIPSPMAKVAVDCASDQHRSASVSRTARCPGSPFFRFVHGHRSHHGHHRPLSLFPHLHHLWGDAERSCVVSIAEQ
jgi:hypothetical protein